VGRWGAAGTCWVREAGTKGRRNAADFYDYDCTVCIKKAERNWCKMVSDFGYVE